MFTVKLHDIDMNVVTLNISDELVNHYKNHPDFDDYDADADQQLDQFWTKFDELLFNQYPDFEDKFDMSELFDQFADLK